MLLLLDDPDSATECVADKHAAEDPRITVLKFNYRNLGQVLRQASEKLSTNYMLRMDADDVAHRRRFEHQMRFMATRPHVVVSGTNVRLIERWGLVFGCSKVPIEHGEILDGLRKGHGSAIVHPTAIFRLDALLACGNYSAHLARGQDLDVFLRISDFGELANSDLTLLDFRKHGSSATSGEAPEEGMSRREKTLSHYFGSQPAQERPPITPLPEPKPHALHVRVLSQSLQRGHVLTFILYAIWTALSLARLRAVLDHVGRRVVRGFRRTFTGDSK